MQEREPIPAYDPGSQVAHAVGAKPADQVPAGQYGHVVVFEPRAADAVPGGQEMHEELEEAPERNENVPAAHGVQKAPATEKEPAAHTTHAPPGAGAVPLGHTSLHAVAPVTEKVPTAHGAQGAHAVPSEAVPAAHGVRVVDVAPVGPKVPAPQE